MSTTTPQPSDKEQYLCLVCQHIGELSSTGRCSVCNEDDVVSIEKLLNVTQTAGLTPVSRPIAAYFQERQWYHIKCGFFECVVSYTKALSLDEALEYARSSKCEWYFVDTPERQPFEVETTLINHSEFLEWCSNKWL